MITTCIEQIYTEEESWSAADSTKDELKEFVEAGGKVCICPLTEASLGDGVFKSLFVKAC